ncbi:MAG: fasciclin domain-containing protein [Verrucomicrobiota bacterium JB022]|nr:fasciclin domain-containing protein [Verrucomicrobiota bacterium JB022]
MKKIYLSTTLAALCLTPAYAQLASNISPAFADATTVEMNGTTYLQNWFGTFRTVDGSELNNEEWIWHEEHGQIYLSADPMSETLWFFDPNITEAGLRGWTFTDRDTHPFMWLNDGGEGDPFWVLYMVGVEAQMPTPRVFYSYATMAPLLLERKSTMEIPEIATDLGFSSLVDAVVAANLASTLNSEGPFTVFAPTNEAFADISDVTAGLSTDQLADVLLYHVVPGTLTAKDLTFDVEDMFSGEMNTFYVTAANGADIMIEVTPMGIMLNGSAMVMLDSANVMADNGVIHAINKVIMPPKDLAGVASDAGFMQLVNAATAAGLVPALTGEDDYTVFAPTDEAFAAIADTVAGLTTPQLVEVLQHHIVMGKVYASEVPMDTEITTLSGGTIDVSSMDGQLMVTSETDNSAAITMTNVPARNGVIHVIDTVLIPDLAD